MLQSSFKYQVVYSLKDIQNKTDVLENAYQAKALYVEPSKELRLSNRAVMTVIGLYDPLKHSALDSSVIDTIPVGLSIAQPIPLGIMDKGNGLSLDLQHKTFLIGGSPGSGKSVASQTIVMNAAKCRDVELWLIDPKRGVEFEDWEPCAKRFASYLTKKDIDEDSSLSDEDKLHLSSADQVLDEALQVMDQRYRYMKANGLKKMSVSDDYPLILLLVDELAELTACADNTAKTKFNDQIRRLISLGRAANITCVLATQRPDSKIVPTSIRDIILVRIAFRTQNQTSSELILNDEAVRDKGASPHEIGGDEPGVGFILGHSDGGAVDRFKSVYLDEGYINQASKAIAEWRAKEVPHLIQQRYADQIRFRDLMQDVEDELNMNDDLIGRDCEYHSVYPLHKGEYCQNCFYASQNAIQEQLENRSKQL